jgi:hypothetical protein
LSMFREFFKIDFDSDTMTAVEADMYRVTTTVDHTSMRTAENGTCCH